MEETQPCRLAAPDRVSHWGGSSLALLGDWASWWACLSPEAEIQLVGPPPPQRLKVLWGVLMNQAIIEIPEISNGKV